MSKMWRGSWALAAVVALIGVAGCSHQEANTEPAATTVSLYERLGGEQNIKGIVDELVPMVVNDPKVDFIRKGTPGEFKATPENVDALKKHLVQFLCHLSGGPQAYEGKDLKQAHAGMGISDAQFDAFAVDFGKALIKCNVSIEAGSPGEDLMTEVQKARADIVEKK